MRTPLSHPIHTCLFLALIISVLTLSGQAQVTLQSGTPGFGSVPVGSSSTVTLQFAFTQDTAISAPVVVTQGYAGLEFSSPGGTCTAATYFAGDSCTVDVTFAPAYPGLRMGAVVITDGGGAVLLTAFLQGAGSGTQSVSAVSSMSGLSFKPEGVTVDAAGFLFLADPVNGRVWKMSSDLSSLALVATGLSYPEAVTVDGAGNIYIADNGANVVWKVAPDGSRTPAGSLPATSPYSSGSPAPMDVAVDGAGNLYVAEFGYGLLKIAPDGTQTWLSNVVWAGSVAVDGTGNVYVTDWKQGNDSVWMLPPGGGQQQIWQGISGGGSALSNARSIAVNGAGIVYLVDSFGNLWRVPPGQTQQLVNAGNPTWSPRRMAFDPAGNAFVTDVPNKALWKVGGVDLLPVDGICGTANGGVFNTAPASGLCASGTAGTVVPGAGGWTWSCSGVGGSTASCSAVAGTGIQFTQPPLPVLPLGSNTGTVAVTIVNASGAVQTSASALVTLAVTGPGGYAQSYSAQAVHGVASFNLSASALTAAGDYTYTASVSGVAPVTADEQVIAGTRVAVGPISTLAGNGTPGYNGDNIPASQAEVNYPAGTVVDAYGNLFIADYMNYRVRVICETSQGPFCSGRIPGNIYTVAGNGVRGTPYNNVAATSTYLGRPWAVGLDAAGNLYIGDDSGSIYVHKVDAITQKITTVAGNWSGICSGATDNSGDGCPATSALLFEKQSAPGQLFGVNPQPGWMDVDAAGDVFVADRLSHQVRVICAVAGGPYCTGLTPGYIYPIVGNGVIGRSPDGTAAASAQFYGPNALAVDGAGSLFIADQGLIRKLDVATMTVSTVAGGGSNWCGYQTDNIGDGCPALNQSLYGGQLAVDGLGNLYDTEYYAQGISGGGTVRFGVVREFDATTQIASTPVGGAAICAAASNAVGDGCPATQALLGADFNGVALDSLGNFFIADDGNQRIRKVTTFVPQPAFSILPSPAITYGDTFVVLSGTLAAGPFLPADGETVTITINGVDTTTTISGGSFGAVIDPTALVPEQSPYTITYSYAGDSGLAPATDSSSKLTVNGPPLWLMVNTQWVNLGDPLPELTYSLSPSIALDTLPVCSSTVDSSNAGYFPGAIACQGAVLAHYKIIYVPGDLVVNPAWPELSLQCPTVAYDGNLHTCAASVTGIHDAPVAGWWSLDPSAETEAGTYVVSGTFYSSDSNYNSGGTVGSTLTILPIDQSPSISCPAPLVYDGTGYGCAIGGGFGDCASTVEASAPGGAVALSCTGDRNHNPWTGTGMITILPATPVVTVVCPPVTYDGKAHGCTATATGLGGAAVAGSFTFTPANETTAGTYAVTADFTSADANYAGAAGVGTLVIKPAPTGTSAATFSATAIVFPAAVMLGQFSAAQYVTIMSTGSAPLQVSGVTLGGANPGDFVVSNQAGTCLTGTSLAYHANCNLRVIFTPAALGARSAILYINDNLAGSPQQITLSGTAVSGAQLTLSATTLNFPATKVGTQAPAQYLTLKSTGFQPVVISRVTISAGDFDLSDQAGTCATAPSTSLVPGASCNIRVKFHPTAKGNLSVSVVITDSSAASPRTVTLNGTGL